MKKIISICTVLIVILSVPIYKYIEFSNERLNNYSDKILSIAVNTNNSIYFLTEQSTSEESFIHDSNDLISNIYALETVLDSAYIFLTGSGIYSNSFYYLSDNLMKELKYNNLNKETIEDLNTITRSTDILIQRLRPYYGTGSNISKKEIIHAIEDFLEEIGKLHYIKLWRD